MKRIYCPVLMYHRVVGDSEPLDRVSVSRGAFARHLDWLRKWGYQTVGASELAGALEGEGRLPARPVILSFDDGFEDNAIHAVPLLRERGFGALVFLVAGFIGGTRTFGKGKGEALLSEAEIRAMAAEGIEFGSHSLTHPQLTVLPRQEAHREIAESKTVVEQVSGRPVVAFCYPYGAVGPRDVELVGEAGYRCAFTTRRGSRHHPRQRLRLKRVWTNEALTRGRLAYRLGRVYDWVNWVRRAGEE